MPRKTALEKARARIEELEAAHSSVSSSLNYVRGERDKARADLETADNFAHSFQAQIYQHRQKIRRLLEQLLSANLRIARREGYIDRIRESDAGVTMGMAIDRDESIDLMRSDLMNATTDRQVSRVLDGLDDETVAEMLGCVDEPQG